MFEYKIYEFEEFYSMKEQDKILRTFLLKIQLSKIIKIRKNKKKERKKKQRKEKAHKKHLFYCEKVIKILFKNCKKQ